MKSASETCADGPGFDRPTFPKKFYAEVLAFFP